LVVGKEAVHQVGRQEYTAVVEKEKVEFLGDIEVPAGNLSG
jgi:hypothetical protein